MAISSVSTRRVAAFDCPRYPSSADRLPQFHIDPLTTDDTAEYLRYREIVATEALARADLMSAHAARRGVVWSADDALAAALIRAAAVRDPARTAAFLARCPAARSCAPRCGASWCSGAVERQFPLL
jgi:hypothetical protein